MKKIILISIFAICILISFTSCDKFCKGIGGGTGYAEKITLSLEEEYASTPDGYGVLMVYFEELCIKENEKVSVFVDNIHIGDILKAAGYRKPPYGEQSESCITCLLGIGYHTIKLKIGEDEMTGDPIEIEQNYCLRLNGSMECK